VIHEDLILPVLKDLGLDDASMAERARDLAVTLALAELDRLSREWNA
jgi:hypothetical protein